jgi:hypothetical protein
MKIVNESWKAVPGYEGRYEVSDLGRVKSIARKKQFILTPASNDTNPRVILCDGHGKNMPLMVHRLVLLAFVGPDERDALRRDKDNTNNRLTNLYYKGDEAKVYGAKKGAIHKLGEGIAKLIRDALALGKSQRQVARECGVAQSTVSRVANGG